MKTLKTLAKYYQATTIIFGLCFFLENPVLGLTGLVCLLPASWDAHSSYNLLVQYTQSPELSLGLY
jgi:hypothetical protein